MERGEKIETFHVWQEITREMIIKWPLWREMLTLKSLSPSLVLLNFSGLAILRNHFRLYQSWQPALFLSLPPWGCNAFSSKSKLYKAGMCTKQEGRYLSVKSEVHLCSETAAATASPFLLVSHQSPFLQMRQSFFFFLCDHFFPPFLSALPYPSFFQGGDWQK